MLLPAAAAPTVDPYQWLEDIEGNKVIDWVKERNASSLEGKELQEKAAKHFTKKEKGEVWVCPMGCATSDKPGKCPKCKMDLTEKK